MNERHHCGFAMNFSSKLFLILHETIKFQEPLNLSGSRRKI